MSDPAKLISKPKIMYFVIFSQKTAFFKLDDILPECMLYREPHPHIEPMVCLQADTACTVGRGCMDLFAKRTYVLFEEVTTRVEAMVLYFRKRNVSGLGAVIVWRPELDRDPRVITMNPYGWAKVKARGNIYQFDPSMDFYMTGMSAPPKEISDKSEDQLLD